MCSVESGSCEASLQSENAPDHVVKSVDGDGSFCCPECGASLRILGCTAVARRNRITLPDWLPEVSPVAPAVASAVEPYGSGAKHEPRQPSAQTHRAAGIPHPPRPSHLQTATQTPMAVNPAVTLPPAVPQPVHPGGHAFEPNSEFVDGDEPTKVHTGLKLPDAAYANGGESSDEVDIDSLLESTSTPTPSLGVVGSEPHAPDARPQEELAAEEQISNADVRQRALHLSLPGLPALVAPPFARRPVGVRLPELSPDRISRPTPTPLPIPGIFGGPIGVKLPEPTQESGEAERSSSLISAAAPAHQDTIDDATSASVSAFPVARAADTERSNEPVAAPAGVGVESASGSVGEAIDPAAVTQRAPVEYATQAAAPRSHPALLAAAVAGTSEPSLSSAEPTDREPSTSAPSASKPSTTPSSTHAGAAEEQKHVLSDAPFIREPDPKRRSATGRLGVWLGLAALCGGAFLLLRSPSRSPSASVSLHAATPLSLPSASFSAQQTPSASVEATASGTHTESSEPSQAAKTTEEDRAPKKDLATAQSPAAEKKPAARESKPLNAESAMAQAKPAPRIPVKAPEQTTEEDADQSEPEQATFEASEAASALDSAATEASSCRQAADPSGVAVVTITFAPSGRVTTATIAGPPFVGTATGSCIAATMRRAKVPPFTGKLVTVRKTVTIQ